MRFPQAKCISLLLVATLATLSVVSSLSIPRKLDAELGLDLAKRAVKHEVATSGGGKDPAPTSRRATNPAPNPSPNPSPRPAPSSTPPVASSLAAPSSSVPHSSSASPSSGAAPASGLSNSNTLSVTQTGGLNSSATNTDSTTSVPTGGLSSPAIGGIAAVGGMAVIGAAIFAVMRYKRKASLTQNLGTKSINQYSGTSPYSGAPFPSGANTGYERLSDPQLSGALAPVGAPSPQQQQQSLGTYTVISTYTPTLGDELEIQPGDKVTLLVEYDDGWCQGVNESRGRVKGVFPKHCVDLGNSQGGMDEMKSKRVSSMYGAGYRM